MDNFFAKLDQVLQFMQAYISFYLIKTNSYSLLSKYCSLQLIHTTVIVSFIGDSQLGQLFLRLYHSIRQLKWKEC